jgi:hypothetical protein
MAFRKELWKRIGGFPETVFFGEDTLFDLEGRRLTKPAFVEGAKALYRPQYTFVSAFNQLASYSVSDGILGVRRARLVRNAARCVFQVLAPLCLLLIRVPAVGSSKNWWWAVIPFLVVLLLQFWYAFHPDWRYLYRKGPRVLLARFFFSILVPWIIAVYHIQGMRTRRNLPNRQNL